MAKRIRKPPKRTTQDRERHERRAYRVLRAYFAGLRRRIEAALKERYGANWTGSIAPEAARFLNVIETRDILRDVLVRSDPEYLTLRFWSSEERLLLRLLIPLLAGSGAAGLAQGEAALLQLSIGVDYTLADAELSKWVRTHAGKLATQLNDNTRKALSQTISTWMQDGTGFPDLIKRTERIVGPKRAEIVAVTETTRAFAEGNTAIWKKSGYIEAREWACAQDELVCPICGKLDGQVAKLGQPFADGTENPPAHVRCRCWIIPAVKELA